MTIKAITFDFWSTLYKPKNMSHTERQQHLRDSIEQASQAYFTLERIQEAVDVAREHWNRAWVEEHRTMGAAEWLKIILGELDTPVDCEPFAKLEMTLEHSVLDSRPSLVPEAHQTLSALAGKLSPGHHFRYRAYPWPDFSAKF